MRLGSHNRILSLWANGERVGRWTLPARGPMELRYDTDWIQSAQGHPVSLSLPFNLHNEPLKGAVVAHYFDNLLPDSDVIRRRIAARFRTGSIEAFDLMREIGRDCVGAVQILGDEGLPASPDRIEAVPMDEAAIKRHLQSVMVPDAFVTAEEPDDDFRIALAGAQEKDAYATAFHTLSDVAQLRVGQTVLVLVLVLVLGAAGGMGSRPWRSRAPSVRAWWSAFRRNPSSGSPWHVAHLQGWSMHRRSRTRMLSRNSRGS